MYANYHTHTFRCGHARGTEREYIEYAIENGIRVMGFSDHAPYLFPNGYESGYRVKTADAQDYFSSLRALREEYKDKIEIHIGFEMEYYPLYFDDMLRYTRELGAEYYILGQHFVNNEVPDGIYSGKCTQDESLLCEYVNEVIEGMKTGVFSYVAHPDVFNFTGDSAVREREWRKICIASRETGIPLEINFLGIRDDRHYPAADFWRIAGEEKSPVIFGFDAHDVKAAWDGESLVTAQGMVIGCGLKLVDEIDISL